MVRVRTHPGTVGGGWRPQAAAVWCFAGFLVVTASVVLGLTQALDHWAFAFARPHDEWGPGQVRWAGFVDALRPPVVATALAVVALAVCLVRRTARPAVTTAAAGAVAAATTLLVKYALARPDPHASGSGHGGSFPSGHTVGVVVCVGLAVHLVWPRARHWPWAVAGVAGVVMGTGLVVIGAHWAGDVVGGLLLGLAVVLAAGPKGGTRPAGPERDRAADDLSGSDQVIGRPAS